MKRKFKKLFIIEIMTITLILSMTGCGENTTEGNNTEQQTEDEHTVEATENLDRTEDEYTIEATESMNGTEDEFVQDEGKDWYQGRITAIDGTSITIALAE
ncbi:MAG: hypothetical protein J6C37_09685, partial [Roseburia sp.]|nr:hypothetical protein [Roseburia sp.]